jgi:hypothetical protein
MCDWNGDGVRTPAIYRGNTWLISNAKNGLNQPTGGFPDVTFSFGQAGDTPICGDWDNDGDQTVGVVRGTQWFLRNSNTPGNADVSFSFGQLADIPVPGDWEGNGSDTQGIVRGNLWFITNILGSPSAQNVVGFGLPGDYFRACDFDMFIGDTPAAIRTIQIDTRTGPVPVLQWFLRLNLQPVPPPPPSFIFGAGGDIPLFWRKPSGP